MSSEQPRAVLVTGGSRGIGRAIAERLARDGFELVLNFRASSEAAEATRAAIHDAGGAARLLPFDVADRDAAREALAADLTEHGPYYGVVLNAGIHQDAVFPGLTGEAWDRVLDTNLGGFYNVLHPLMMPMVRAHRGGRIVIMSSASGQVGRRGQVNYSASKAGLIGATRSLAQELAKRAITVNCVAPGVIDTDMASDIPEAEIQQLVPMRRAGQPEEVAHAVSYLCSDGASYVTGQVLAVNGGMV